MNFNKIDLKFSIHDLHKKGLDNPVLDQGDLFKPKTIIEHSIIRPAVLDKEKIVVATFMWFTPKTKMIFKSALLFSLSEAAKILPQYRIKFSKVKNASENETNVWLPLVFGENYKPELIKLNPFDNILDNYRVNFYTVYLDNQFQVMNI
jgi:hypothetical protein